MKHKLRVLLSSWVFWVLCLSVSGAAAFCFAMLTTPMSEEALKLVLKKEMFKQVEIKNIHLKSKSFDLFKLEWSFELSANVEEIWGLPIKIKDLSLEGSKKLFRDSVLKKAVMRFSEDEKIFKGGIVVHKDEEGKVIWDLSNLDFSIGSLEKKMGVAAFLNIDSESEKELKAHVIYDQLKIPMEITRQENSVVIQIPKTTLKTQKQKLPFRVLSQIPSTGEWTFASRVEMRGDTFTEASNIEVSNAMLSLANVDTSFVRNGRGVGVLNANIISSENLLNGTLDINLDNATFELNEGRYFKADGVPFSVNAKLLQSAGDLNIESLKSSLNAKIDRDGSIDANLKNFDFAILPNTQKLFGKSIRGFVTAKAEAKLLTDLLGGRSVELLSLKADESKVVIEDFQAPLLSVKGSSEFEGRFSYALDRKSIDGSFNFTKADVHLDTLFVKNKNQELVVKLKADYVDKQWKTYEVETSIDGQFLKARGNASSLTLNFPNTFKTQSGALLSGSMTYDICQGFLCNDAQPTAFNLKLSDYESPLPYLSDLKLSGRIVKKGEQFELDSFTVRWPSGDNMQLDGNLEKFKTAKLKVRGVFNYKNFSLSNPFLFFKEMPLQQATLDFNLNIRNNNDEWTLRGQSVLENKKLNFDSLELSQNNQTNYDGHVQIDLEPYLHRNEAVTLTATLKNSGSLSAFEGLLMRGTYSANLVLASSGLNADEFISRLKLRASGEAEVDQLPLTLLISQGLNSYAKEKEKAAANVLAKCYPQKMRGKFDFDYSEGRWNLAPSAFQGTDRDSIVKIQGSLGDLSSVNLISHYLPGPVCGAELASCLGDAFPKGGMSFEITGAFKDPETDLDFAFIDQSLERCREIEARREVATESPLDTRDQNVRIQELKDFYKSRKLAR